MTPLEYKTRALATAVPEAKNLTYMIVGLTNEAGEVAGKLKKVMRGDVSLESQIDGIIDELGDTLWYLTGAAHSLGFCLEEVMLRNIHKLEQRRAKGTLRGNGDSR